MDKLEDKMKVAVLGCGNMASAVVFGIYNHNKNIEFLTYTPSKTKAIELAKKVDGKTIDKIDEAKEADIFLIGCKPQQFNELAQDLLKLDIENKVLISMMAAISLQSIDKKIPNNKIVRLMPSLPMNYNEGISLLYFNPDFDKKPEIKSLFEGSSKVYEVKSEKQFNELTVATASGPAFVYYFCEIFQRIIEGFGIEEAIAKEMAVQLFKGSSISMDENESSLIDQISKVTSKGGVTIEGINSFNKNNLVTIINQGVNDAIKRSFEMEKMADS